MKNLLTLVLVLVTLSTTAQRRGQSEFFLEINESGLYTVTVNDEAMQSARGRFRFHDLQSGRHRVSVELNGRQVFRQEIDLGSGLRTIAHYSRSSGLRIRHKLPLQYQNRYNLDSWDGELINESEKGGYRPGKGLRRMAPQDFAHLKRMVEKESFDSNRQKLLKISLRDNAVSVEQLEELLSVLSFDDARLEIAMHAYETVIDPENYYRLLGTFRLSSSKEKLQDFLEAQHDENKAGRRRTTEGY